MKLLLIKTVRRLGQIGDVVDVKNGYARNYLIPQNLAVMPTEANLKAIEVGKQKHLEQLAKIREEVEARAQVLRGKEVTISARANDEGHLYGSVGPAQIVAALAEQEIFIEADLVDLEHPIRQLDKYDVPLHFNEEVSATIHVWVVRAHDEESDQMDDEQLHAGLDDLIVDDKAPDADAADADAADADDAEDQ